MKVQLLELMDNLVHQRKVSVLILAKQTQNFVSVYMIMLINKNVKFPTQFCLGSISNALCVTESREVPLNEKVYDFSVDYNSIDTLHKK